MMSPVSSGVPRGGLSRASILGVQRQDPAAYSEGQWAPSSIEMFKLGRGGQECLPERQQKLQEKDTFAEQRVGLDDLQGAFPIVTSSHSQKRLSFTCLCAAELPASFVHT